MKRICPQCGAEMKENALFCGKCGAKYEETKVCPRCQAVIRENSRFCTKCGYKLFEQKERNNNILKFIIAVILIIAIFALPLIAVPIVVLGGIYILLKKKGIWDRANKTVAIGGMAVVAVICFILTDIIINPGADIKRQVNNEMFKEKFCENIGVEYLPDAWARTGDNGELSEGYSYAEYYSSDNLTVMIMCNENDVVLNAGVQTNMNSSSLNIAITGDYDSVFDREFLWKCATVSAIGQYDMDKAEEMVRSANKSGQEVITYDELQIHPYTESGNGQVLFSVYNLNR